MSEVNTPESIGDGIPQVTFTLSVPNTVQAPIDPTLSIEGEAADAKATGDAIAAAKAELQEEIDALDNAVDAIPGTLFPVGAIIMTDSGTAPTFGGTWTEILIPATWGDIQDGMRSYSAGTGTGTIHFWRRTA